MKIMAVDYGDARTGLAISDNSEFLASPVCTIKEYDIQKLAEKIALEAKNLNVQQIIVGLPINMNGTCGERAEKCRNFAQILEKTANLPVEMWDERSTTVTAHMMLNQTNVRGKKRKAVVDTVAAVIILQSYLDYRKKKLNNAFNEKNM